VSRRFVIWLDASDGSLPTFDGIQWPDGTVTIHHRHFPGVTSNWPTAETAAQTVHSAPTRIEWTDPEEPE
jgi:hypothetical protein